MENIVLEALRLRIKTVMEVSDLLAMTDIAAIKEANLRKLRGQLEQKQAEAERQQKYLNSLYENLADGIIDQEEYRKFKVRYTARREEAEKQADAIQSEMSKELTNAAESRAWIERFRENLNLTSLDRAVVVTLIDRILVSRDRTVEIVFSWDDEFQWLSDLVSSDGHPEKGVC